MAQINYSLVDGAEPMAQTAIRLPEYQYKALSEIAKSESRTRSSVIRHAIRLYLEAYQDQAQTPR